MNRLVIVLLLFIIGGCKQNKKIETKYKWEAIETKDDFGEPASVYMITADEAQEINDSTIILKSKLIISFASNKIQLLLSNTEGNKLEFDVNSEAIIEVRNGSIDYEFQGIYIDGLFTFKEDDFLVLWSLFHNGGEFKFSYRNKNWIVAFYNLPPLPKNDDRIPIVVSYVDTLK
jgi:mRNA-degrading endonuclease HigB of HigAB toxin-antitoxin module